MAANNSESALAEMGVVDSGRLLHRFNEFVGGRDDLDARLIRAIGDPFERFTEDKLRLVRAVRFAVTFNFAIEAETGRAIGQMADQITVVSAETRIAPQTCLAPS